MGTKGRKGRKGPKGLKPLPPRAVRGKVFHVKGGKPHKKWQKSHFGVAATLFKMGSRAIIGA